MNQPRLLIEDWLPATAIGVECIRERSTGQQPPDKRLHVWWARRPLSVSRAAVLGSLLPADFPRDVFERLLGFGKSGEEIVEIRRLMDTGYKVPGGFGYDRAFKRGLRADDLGHAHGAASRLWGREILVVDPMAGGGSIPLEAARLGFQALASEYNPVACSVLEATVDYPFRFGERLGKAARKWAAVWSERIEKRLASFYPIHRFAKVHAYVFARTVPCPETQHPTPLVPDWCLLKPKRGVRIVAEPVVNKSRGTWSARIREIGTRAGQLREPPLPTYDDAKGISLFTNLQIPAGYVKAKAQAGQMGSALYAVALKGPKGLRFQPPEPIDLEALEAAEKELARLRPGWEKANLIPTEVVPDGDQPGTRLVIGGIQSWADMFSPRQLLAFGVLVEELRRLRSSVVNAEGEELGEAVLHLLAMTVDKLANHNSILARFENTRQVIKGVFGRHGYEFHATFAEMAPCNAGSGLGWAIDNVIQAYEKLVELPRHPASAPVDVSLGSATNLPQIADGSSVAVVVDPPYDANVQYSELANFFYVWLKRTQGHRRPEWFSTYLCEHDHEAVVNLSRHRKGGGKATAQTRKVARAFYRRLMTDTFRECRRILRDDGVLTVMFTHKKQEAWEALFTSLIEAGFTITATWPVKTESEHSLHQARKNAAQSTVLLVARKRPARAGVGYFDSAMQAAIRERARTTAERLQGEGLNPVDQLVGSFGPAMEVYSRHDAVRTDTGDSVGVDRAIDEASEAVSAWRIERLAARGLEGVEPEGRFVLLCWDVLGAEEFRFNEAHLLGKAVDMDVDRLVAAGLVTRSGDKIKMVPAKDRRRARPLEADEIVETLFGPERVKKGKKKPAVRKIHPNDPEFRTALDACHALALRYLEGGSSAGGVGSARALARQQRWAKDSAVARLMHALVQAAPEAVRRERGRNSVAAHFPEFRAWQALLKPLFEIEPPDWTEKPRPQLSLLREDGAAYGEGADAPGDDLEDEDEEEDSEGDG